MKYNYQPVVFFFFYCVPIFLFLDKPHLGNEHTRKPSYAISFLSLVTRSSLLQSVGMVMHNENGLNTYILLI